MLNNFIQIITALVTFPLFITACSDKKQTDTKTDDAVIVRTQPVSVTDYSSNLQYSGKLASASETNLSFKISGIISGMYVKEGDYVSRGQLLATLDLTEINAQVQQARQNAEKSDRDFTRVKNLFNDTAATLEQYQNTETQQKVAGENLRIASFNQRYAQIRASDDGTIVRKIMNEGEFASAGALVFTMNATSAGDWIMRFGVSDKDWALIKKGNTASVQIDAYPNETFKGIITKTAEAADPVSGTYEMEVKVLPEGKKFAAGLFCTVQLSTAAKQKVTLIPIEALTEGNAKTGYVYLVNDDKKSVTKRKVEIAFVDNDKVAIRSGLDNVTNVITDGVSYLTDNATVKVLTYDR